MFSNTSNIQGTASCQEDYRTFEINRYAQAISWSQDVLESYLNDLCEAKKNKRNLMAEKYARMMQTTAPREYEKIAHLFPPLDPELQLLVEKITAIFLDWEIHLRAKYVNLANRSRPLYSSSDNSYTTSLETYLRGELTTYSLKTLKLYYSYAVRLNADNLNGAELILENMLKCYGFKSLQEAEAKLREA